MNICLDSFVIVAALRKQEVHYEAAKKLLEKIKDGEYIAIEPYIVLIEIVAAIKRRTGSTELAKRVNIVIQTAKEFNVLFITLDMEMIEKAKSFVDIRSIADL